MNPHLEVCCPGEFGIPLYRDLRYTPTTRAGQSLPLGDLAERYFLGLETMPDEFWSIGEYGAIPGTLMRLESVAASLADGQSSYDTAAEVFASPMRDQT